MEELRNESTSKKDKQKNFKLNLTRNGLIALGVVVVMLYLGVLIVLKRYDIVEYEKERTRLENLLIEKEQEVQELQEMIKNAEDPKFIEKVARENLKMVKPNETVYIVNK